MDGTIVDSTAVVETIWRQFAERFGIDVDELFAYSHGRRSPDTVRHFLPEGFDPVEVTREQEARELTLVEGIVEVAGAGRLLEQLEEAPVAVVTSAPRELAEIRMKAAGLTIPRVLIAAEDAEHGKPSPQGYLMAAEQLGVDIADCVIFEDADAGIQAAVASGAHTIVVGGLDSPAAEGLERIPDFTSVTAEFDPESKRITFQM